MKKNKSMAALLLGMTALLLTGCISEEERAQAEAWRKRAEENAITYIKEKYGFNATVIESKSQRVSDLFAPHFTSETLVTMEYDGEQFKVLSFGEDEYMDEATDNYQKDEITAAYKEEVTKLFGVEPDDFALEGGANGDAPSYNDEEFYDMFFREYYDGTNLEEVMLEHIVNAVAEYVGDLDLETLYEQNKTPLFEDKNNELAFVLYDSRENMELSEIKPNDAHRVVVYENAMYVKRALVRLQDEVIPIQMSVGECDGFYYMNPYADVSEYRITEREEIYDVSDFKGHGFANPAFSEDTAYYFEGDTEVKLYLYVPKEKYEQISRGESEKKPVVVSKCYDGETGKESYKIWHGKEIPGYEVFYYYNANADDLSFRFMYDAKESD